MESMHFPQFRKLPNDKSFYRIDDEKHFYEIQIIGSKCVLSSTEAVQYPEIIRIQDMLKLTEPFIESTIEEFHTHYIKSMGK